MRTIATALLALTLLATGHADTLGNTVYKKLAAKVRAARSITGTVKTTINGQSFTDQFALMKPGYFKMVGPAAQIYITPATYYFYLPTLKQYSKTSAMGPQFPIIGFEMFGTKTSPAWKPGATKKQKFGGRDCYAMTIKNQVGARVQQMLYVDAKTYLPAGNSMKVLVELPGRPKRTNVSSAVYSNIKLNTKLSPANFVFKPPPGAKEQAPVVQPNMGAVKK